MVRRTLGDDDIDAIRAAAGRQDVVAAMEAFYAALDATVAGHGPVCTLRGACCRFDEYGHNLFVTTLEAAYFVARDVGVAAGEEHSAVRAGTALSSGCPYQIGGRCAARDRRPMGCRIFFCDPQSRPWQGPLTEATLGRLRSLHEQLGVPYVYAEWREILESLGL